MENGKKRNWFNLLKNRCPQCRGLLWFDKDEPMICCNSLQCGFMIEQKRMLEIVSDLTTRKLDWSADLEGKEGGWGVDNSDLR